MPHSRKILNPDMFLKKMELLKTVKTQIKKKKKYLTLTLTQTYTDLLIW